jgi:hypothetical protein
MSEEVPVEVRMRTPEEVAADKAKLAAEIERMRLQDAARGGPPVAPIMRKREEGSLDETLERIRAKAEEAEAERKSLPCFAGLEADDEDAAVDACELVEGWKACRWATTAEACPRARAIVSFERVEHNLSSPPAAVRVPEREASLIVAAARRRGRVPLLKLDTYNLVRSVLTRKRLRQPLENGAEVRRDGSRLPGEVFLTGTEVLVVLGGNQGRGKTLAVCYAIARQGGVYTRAPQWTRRASVDIEAAIAAPVLVIDQFGREHFGESEWALSQFEDVIDTRFQSPGKWTFLVGNLQWEQFTERLKKTTIVDRLVGDGVYVEFGGDSLRAGLRAAALKGQP